MIVDAAVVILAVCYDNIVLEVIHTIDTQMCICVYIHIYTHLHVYDMP